MKKILTITFIFCLFTLPGFSQKKLVWSQYMHNQFSINPAFAGSREVLTAFGGYRKQWTGVPVSPYGQFLTAHAPLKNDNVAFGVTFFNEKFAIAQNTGFSVAYAYRLKLANESRLAFSLNGGFVSSKSGWEDVSLIDPDDDAFGENETGLDPKLGFGIAYYNNNFFAGFSITDFFYKSGFDKESPFFEPAKTDYLFTAGYFYDVSHQLAFQPSMLLRVNPEIATVLDVSATILIQKLIWTGITYRTNKRLLDY
jgi:type IX secretion system PorP/SprF family membrane protein